MSDLYTIGDTLRKKREELGLYLEDIENATKISKRYLRAIEAGHWDKLPEMVYTRGFIRMYARQLHINVESLLKELEEGPFDESSPSMALSYSAVISQSHAMSRVAQMVGRCSRLGRFVFGLTGKGT